MANTRELKLQRTALSSVVVLPTLGMGAERPDLPDSSMPSSPPGASPDWLSAGSACPASAFQLSVSTSLRWPPSPWNTSTQQLRKGSRAGATGVDQRAAADLAAGGARQGAHQHIPVPNASPRAKVPHAQALVTTAQGRCCVGVVAPQACAGCCGNVLESTGHVIS